MSAHRVRPARDRQSKTQTSGVTDEMAPSRREEASRALCAPPAPPEGHYLIEGLPSPSRQVFNI